MQIMILFCLPNCMLWGVLGNETTVTVIWWYTIYVIAFFFQTVKKGEKLLTLLR